jgi:hypothetical protein
MRKSHEKSEIWTTMTKSMFGFVKSSIYIYAGYTTIPHWEQTQAGKLKLLSQALNICELPKSKDTKTSAQNARISMRIGVRS